LATSSSTGGLSPRPDFHSSHNSGAVVTVLSNPYWGTAGSVGASSLTPLPLDSAGGGIGDLSDRGRERLVDRRQDYRACTLGICTAGIWICALARR
jgi:hypothetical protein